MASRNDPERLQAEAKELMEQYQNAATQPSAEDTEEQQEEVFQKAPSEPEDTAEAIAEEVPEEELVGGDDSEAEQRIEKAERAMKGAQAKMTKATQEAAELRKQVSDLVNSVTQLKGQLADEQRNTEKLQQVREEYPDVAGPLLDELDQMRARLDEQAALTQGQERRAFEAKQEEAVREHFDRIRAVHSDVDEVTQTSDWALWLDAQDSQVHEWVDAGSSNDVIFVLDRFKADMGVKPETPQESALARAKEVAEPKLPKARKANVTGGKKSWTVQDIVNMPLAEFEKHKVDILRAQAEGSIRR
jgi:hypothetical protein